MAPIKQMTKNCRFLYLRSVTAVWFYCALILFPDFCYANYLIPAFTRLIHLPFHLPAWTRAYDILTWQQFVSVLAMQHHVLNQNIADSMCTSCSTHLTVKIISSTIESSIRISILFNNYRPYNTIIIVPKNVHSALGPKSFIASYNNKASTNESKPYAIASI